MDKDEKKRGAGDISLDEIREQLWQAVRKLGEKFYLSEVYASFLIFENDGKFFQTGWSFLDGQAQLGSERVEVEREWVETRSKQAELDERLETTLRLEGARDPEGSAWDVTICEPGFTKNGWFLPEDVLRAAAGLFEQVDVNLYEFPEVGATHVPENIFDIKRLLVKNKAGWIDQVRFVAGQGLKGVLHFLDSAKWLGKNLAEALKTGGEAYGLSYDCPVRAVKDTVEGKTVFRVLKFLSADSVDIVSRPAAGGKFNRAIAAQKKMEGQIMDKEQLLAMIQKNRPDLLEGKDVAALGEDEVVELARMAMEQPPAAAAGGDDPPEKKPLTHEDFDLLRCEMALKETVKNSTLPDLSQARVLKMFDGKIFKPEDLTRAIADEKDFLAAVLKKDDPPGEGVPALSAIVGIGTIEKARMAVDRTFGLTEDDMKTLAVHERLDHKPFFQDYRSVQDVQDFSSVPAFSGLREMYEFFTGDPEVTGRFNQRNLPPDLRAKADITSGTFSYVLGNTLGRRMVKDYLAADFQESLLISSRKPVKDFRQQEAVLVGYFGDLDTVDPEAADYDEISAVTDEESTYTLGQKGNILTISRKTIINDDLSLIARLVSRLGRAARRTFAQYVWNFFINNSNCSDGTAWFTVGHGNLGTTALSFATALVAYKAVAKFTEKDSDKRIGLLDDPNAKPTLVYPIDLMETGGTIVEDDHYYATNDLTDKTRNPLHGKINGAQVSLLTDANDWGLLMPAALIDMIEMGFLNGRQEPEMFVADTPQSEQVFVADKIRHKIRHEYAGAPVDYRSGYKAVVA